MQLFIFTRWDFFNGKSHSVLLDLFLKARKKSYKWQDKDTSL